MRWGIAFFAWVLTGLYLANHCVDYVRLWQNPLPGYTRERVLPHLQSCGSQQAIDYGKATIGILALYYGSGWGLSRLRARRRESGREHEGGSPDACVLPCCSKVWGYVSS